MVNLYTEELGNPEVPQKFLQARHKAGAAVPVAAEKPTRNRSWIIAAAVIIFGRTCSGRISVVAAFCSAVGTDRRAVQSIATVGRPGGASLPSAATANVPEKSIAVLPFENLSEDKENAFFTDGVQDEILTDLAKIADLKVISRTSVMQYKTGTHAICARSRSSSASRTWSKAASNG